jgi:hypothetical protein
MCYQICNILRQVRQVQRSQIRFIPVAVRLLVFLVYIFLGLLYVSPLALSQSYLTHDYLVSSSGLALCPYGVGAHMHEISLHLHVRKNETSLIRIGAV